MRTIAERLNEGTVEQNHATSSIDDASILFADIAGYTKAGQ